MKIPMVVIHVLILVRQWSSVTSVLFMTNITSVFQPESDTLRIDFDTSKFNYLQYEVELWPAKEVDKDCESLEGTYYAHENIPSQFPTTQTVLTGPFPTGLYCIRVRPLRNDELLNGSGGCGSGCRAAFTIIYLNTTDVPDCTLWNASLSLEPHSTELIVYLLVLKPYELCFQSINVSLWYNASGVCNSHTGQQVETTSVNVTPLQRNQVEFHSLIPGNYCVRLRAWHISCHPTYCSPLYSSIVSLPPPGLVSSSPAPPILPRTSVWLYILLASGSFFLPFGFLMCWWIRKSQPTKPRPFSCNEELTIPDLILHAKERARSLEVLLLYSMDFPEHGELIASLRCFLLDSWGLKKIHLDREEEAVIAVDPHSWVQKLTTPDPERRIIIVESEGAVIQEEGRKLMTIVLPKEEDYLDELFPFALQTIKRGTNGPWDYKSLFVVRFLYTPENLRLQSFVPHRRFLLPEHFFDLYWSILDLDHYQPTSSIKDIFKMEVMSKWNNSLLSEVNRLLVAANLKVMSNPNLVRDAFNKIPGPGYENSEMPAWAYRV